MHTLIDLQELFFRHSKWLVITGAGISVDSGIPTYRDDSGQWLRSDPIKHHEFINSEKKRKRYWARSFRGWPPVASAKPNDAHHLLAELERNGNICQLITQNVDRLHQKAGHKNVIDLHGRLDRVKCLNCAQYETRESLQARLLARNIFLRQQDLQTELQMAPDGDAVVEDAITERLEPVSCLHCDGMLMPDVVFFGGTLESETREACQQSFDQCDGLIVFGSSLSVYSAFRFCKMAAQTKKPLIIVNRGKTRADEIADLRIESDCATTLKLLLETARANR